MAATGGRGKPPFSVALPGVVSLSFRRTFERGNGSSEHAKRVKHLGEKESAAYCVPLTSGEFRIWLIYKAMHGGVESQRPGVTAGSRTLVCARPADGRIQQAFPRKFTAGHAWLSPSGYGRKGGTDYAPYNR